ncbi:DUF1015 domain-containing protein [Methanorbis rubei]|uniref:DUF1015 domain-containing protein n=1 Tax=Methanorbis rubei TaxID=3028300 RepID=A0AAE4MGQ3_9EURY|nr:hypothetical protein [Methanocorpusculaceae archaeon Cs1]
MVTIYPFTGLHPSDAAYPLVPSVPYDVISAEEAAAEIAKNDKTLLRVIRPDAELPDIDPHDDRIYERAHQMFEQMKSSGLLVDDSHPAFYLYRITLGGETFTGLISCVSVAEYKDDIIKKHELTRYDKEEDRTRHIDAVSAHTGQVFLLYKDPGTVHAHISALADSMQPFGEYRSAGGNLHQIYRVDDAKEIAKLEQMFAAIPNLYIADGHHRAKSSANVFDRRSAEGRSTPDAERFMSVLFAHDKVRIYGYHRLVRDLAGMNADQFLGDLGLRFTVTPVKKIDTTKNAVPPMAKVDGSTHIIHLYLESEWYELTRQVDPAADAIERLDVSVLQESVLDDMLAIIDPRGDPRIAFVGGIVPLADVVKEVDAGEYSAAFIMQPVTAQGVIDVADNAMIMPPKSTWFEPKLLSGMVIHEIH